jgi:hypothetical protein
MDRDPFVVRANIARYHHLLRTERDEGKRQTLRRLLAEAEAKMPAGTTPAGGPERASSSDEK